MRRKKSIIVFLFTAVAFSVSAQNKGRRKIKVDREKEEVVTIKDTTTSFQEERPTYHITQEDRERMKYTKTIPIGTNVFVQLVFSSAVQVVRSGAPDMAMVKNEDNVVTIQALREDVKSNISVKTADGLYYSYKIVSEDDKDIPLFYEIPIADAVNGKSKLIEDNKRKIVEKMSAQEVAQTIYSYDGYIKNRNVGSYKDIYIIGEKGLKETLSSFNQHLDSNNVEAVIVGLDRELTYKKLTVATRSVLSGAELIGTNPDTLLPTAEGFIPSNGGQIKYLEHATSTAATVIGKPNRIIMESAMNLFNYNKDDIVMVGDNYDTDIMSGINSNIDTIHVQTGVTTLDQLKEKEIQPTYTIEDLSKLID